MKRAWFFIFLVPQICLAGKTAVMISGGGNPTTNMPIFFKQLESLDRILPDSQWKKLTFAAGGPQNPAPNIPEGSPHAQILRETNGRIRLTRRVPPGQWVGAAVLKDLQTIPQKILQETRLTPQEDFECHNPVFIYINDHGGMGRGGNSPETRGDRTASLWKEYLTTKDLRQIIMEIRKVIPEKCPIILDVETCFGGGLLYATRDDNGLPMNNICGSSYASPEQVGYAEDSFMFSAEKKLKRSPPGTAFSLRDIYSEHRKDFYDSSATNIIFPSPTTTSDLFLQDYFHQHKLNLIDKRDELVQECLFQDSSQILPGDIPQLLQVLFNQEMEKLKFDIMQGLDDFPKSSFLTLKRELDEDLKNLENLYRKRTEQNAILKQSAYEWMKTHKDYGELMASLERIKSELQNLGPDGGDQDKAATLRDKYDHASVEIDQVMEVATNNKDHGFRRHLIDSIMARLKPGEKFESPLLEVPAYLKKIEDTQKYIAQKWRLMENLTHFNSLNHMIKNKDIQSFMTYLQLVECEKTPLFQKAP